ncbi:hypothetical protein Q7C_1672 [Methylophaga frappieri]|uniref:Uncharacterized protein n=2 Tax=Methylophaga frappieri (strain ATCC BAA-2434 / DSM 25690 / JAM7) TaxID=754477 RepID=I1YIS7_METFJ|nr:hypothetical protein Q7C_1672 [Methylophaga frappieri]
MQAKQFWLWGVVLLSTLAIGILMSPNILTSDWLDKLDSDDDVVASDSEKSAPSLMAVELDSDLIELAGIKTAIVKEAILSPEVRAWASVHSVQPLLEQRGELVQQQAQRKEAEVVMDAMYQEWSRLQELATQAGSIANKEVASAKAKWQAAKARFDSAQLHFDLIKNKIAGYWPETIADWITADNSLALNRIVSRQDSLLRVSLPVGSSLNSEVKTLSVVLPNQEKALKTATFIAPVLSGNQSAFGQSYYFLIKDTALPESLRLDVWVPKQPTALKGVSIPGEALVWYGGQQWIYVRRSLENFQRVSAQSMIPTAIGVFDINNLISPQEKVVIRGAQTLLSEEFKWQIMDEDDDDDDD